MTKVKTRGSTYYEEDGFFRIFGGLPDYNLMRDMSCCELLFPAPLEDENIKFIDGAVFESFYFLQNIKSISEKCKEIAYLLGLRKHIDIPCIGLIGVPIRMIRLTRTEAFINPFDMSNFLIKREDEYINNISFKLFKKGSFMWRKYDFSYIYYISEKYKTFLIIYELINI